MCVCVCVCVCLSVCKYKNMKYYNIQKTYLFICDNMPMFMFRFFVKPMALLECNVLSKNYFKKWKGKKMRKF